MSAPTEPAQMQRMIDLAAEGYSASRIAQMLGGGLTRNAVIGRLHRNGKRCNSTGGGDMRIKSERPPREKAVRRARIARAPRPATEPEPLIREDGSIVTIGDVRSTECRWPKSEVSAEMQMCGHKTATFGKPWCAYHEGTAWNPSPPRVTGAVR